VVKWSDILYREEPLGLDGGVAASRGRIQFSEESIPLRFRLSLPRTLPPAPPDWVKFSRRLDGAVAKDLVIAVTKKQ
jgi:hypothetical protein